MTLLVLGAAGFVGTGLSLELANRQIEFSKAVRFAKLEGELSVGDLVYPSVVSTAVFAKMHTVVYCAGLAHQRIGRKGISFSEYYDQNLKALNFAAQAAADAGVRRFIFLSSVNVNGLKTLGNAISIVDDVVLEDVVGQCKYDSELTLFRLGHVTGMEIVCIRSPMVYGINPPGNFGALQKLVLSGLPLPLGAVNNQRSLVALDNLVDLIITCIDHPAAANQTFLVSDDDDVSTTELLRRMAQAFGKKQLLLPIPKWAMTLPAKLLGKQGAVDRLYGSLQVDITHTKNTLGWRPPVTMQQQLRKIADSLNNK